MSRGAVFGWHQRFAVVEYFRDVPASVCCTINQRPKLRSDLEDFYLYVTCYCHFALLPPSLVGYTIVRTPAMENQRLAMQRDWLAIDESAARSGGFGAPL
jgi:hypothetical protein